MAKVIKMAAHLVFGLVLWMVPLLAQDLQLGIYNLHSEQVPQKLRSSLKQAAMAVGKIDQYSAWGRKDGKKILSYYGSSTGFVVNVEGRAKVYSACHSVIGRDRPSMAFISLADPNDPKKFVTYVLKTNYEKSEDHLDLCSFDVEDPERKGQLVNYPHRLVLSPDRQDPIGAAIAVLGFPNNASTIKVSLGRVLKKSPDFEEEDVPSKYGYLSNAASLPGFSGGPLLALDLNSGQVLGVLGVLQGVRYVKGSVPGPDGQSQELESRLTYGLLSELNSDMMNWNQRAAELVQSKAEDGENILRQQIALIGQHSQEYIGQFLELLMLRVQGLSVDNLTQLNFSLQDCLYQGLLCPPLLDHKDFLTGKDMQAGELINSGLPEQIVAQWLLLLRQITRHLSASTTELAQDLMFRNQDPWFFESELFLNDYLFKIPSYFEIIPH